MSDLRKATAHKFGESAINTVEGAGVYALAADKMDEAVMNYLKRKYNLLIGERTAERIGMEIGSAHQIEKPMTIEIKGRDLIEGVPKTITVEAGEIREALSKCVPTGRYTILYVGMASDLRHRLKDHLNNPPVAGITHFFAERIDNKAARRKREGELALEFMPVGNALESLPRPTLMEAAYLAARVLWHRGLLSPGEVDRALTRGYPGHVPELVRRAADQLLRAIEAAEGSSIESLDRDTTTRYLNLLSDTIRNRNAVDIGYDPSQGHNLLSQLREGQSTR
jgi:hypothetical protein